ncbi:NAD-dependent deacetylase hst3 [Coemansia spiralis]|uniref:NAD-dependent deacetylase hst3 n=2 Tax=Coemansia TaxID=4863 RepID=A0A9W8G2Q8_9FUNG|nr:NAD-dependent deacetylase hst3 [Coemansia umbellata]KAJ2619650.1 NAD-dependent deacetylase hst3 [Coemansia sp. RSA 1358]KAJ2671792.1 NAD-dependent deacetylase hst3 [Coemansia spiralis]
MKRLALSDICSRKDDNASDRTNMDDDISVLEEAQRAVRASQRCIVITGAGISVSSGIPDFRSPQGLFQQLKQKYPSTVSSGRDLFDASLFQDPSMVGLFYNFMGELRTLVSQATCSPTHAFIKQLDEHGKLLRCYTQNIDALEKKIGLETAFAKPEEPHLSSSASDANSTATEEAFSSQSSSASSRCASRSKRRRSPSPVSTQPTQQKPASRRRRQTTLDKTFTRAVQLHGDLDNVICTICHTRYPFTDKLVAEFCSGAPPPCPRCKEIEVIRDIVGKRSVASGFLRPDIVLYNESHPQGELIGALSEYDLKQRPDLLIVIGTSLKIPGIKRMIKEMSRCVHSCSARTRRAGAGKAIFINKGEPPKGWDDVFDYYLEGDSDQAVRLLPLSDTVDSVYCGLQVSEAIGPVERCLLPSSSSIPVEPSTKKNPTTSKRSSKSSAVSLSSLVSKASSKNPGSRRVGLSSTNSSRTKNAKLTSMMKVVKRQSTLKPKKVTQASSNCASPCSPPRIAQDTHQPEQPRSPLVSSSC